MYMEPPLSYEGNKPDGEKDKNIQQSIAKVHLE